MKRLAKQGVDPAEMNLEELRERLMLGKRKTSEPSTEDATKKITDHLRACSGKGKEIHFLEVCKLFKPEDMSQVHSLLPEACESCNLKFDPVTGVISE